MYIKSLYGNTLCLFCMRHHSRSRINGWEDTLLGSFWLSLKYFEIVQPEIGLLLQIDIFPFLCLWNYSLFQRTVGPIPRHDSRLVRQSSALLPMTGLGSSTLQNCGQELAQKNNLLEKLGMVFQLLNRDTRAIFHLSYWQKFKGWEDTLWVAGKPALPTLLMGK